MANSGKSQKATSSSGRQPHQYFDYEIRPQIGDAGSYFYHSHVGFQAVSAAGPLIIEEQAGQSPPYSYDDERTMFLTELYNKTDDMIVERLSEPLSTVAWTGEAGTFLVNGKSYAPLDADQTQTPQPWTQPNPSLMTDCGPEVIEVEPGKTYRMRMIGAMALNLVNIGFQDHTNITVIAADASYVQPAETDRIQLGSGQRFDLLLQTKTESELQSLGKSLFWIQIDTRYRPINSTAYALLSYKTITNTPSLNHTIPSSPPSTPPLSVPTDFQSWLEYTLSPLTPSSFPPSTSVSRHVYLSSAQLTSPSGLFFSVQNRTWTESNQHLNATPFSQTIPSTGPPYLTDIYRRGQAALPNYTLATTHHSGWDPTTNTYPAQTGEVIDIILINQPDGLPIGFDLHPWHVHGGHVWDLGSGPGEYDAGANEERIRALGWEPALRDTTMLYKYTESELVGEGKNYTSQGWRAWRLRVEEPGVWMIHCHTLQHMVLGMQTVWVMGNASEITGGTAPDLVEGYLEFGGSAYGNATHDPLVNHYFD
ncbi:MAG: hypothetical protein Q9160_006295 [Pyrenula sp. 1 TL-2023]